MSGHLNRILTAGFSSRHCLRVNIRRKIPMLRTIAKRGILSEAFTKNVGGMYQVPQSESEQLTSLCLQIDRCSEKGQPFSSLVIDRLVNAIEDSDDIKTTMYYLHKFRHSKTCYFLRPWTSHVWIKKCIAHNEMDLALQALKNRIHYAIFPDETTFNLIINHCLTSKQYGNAFAFLSQMFLVERMQSNLSHILALVTLLRFMNGSPLNLQNLNEKFENLEEKRNFGGVCYRWGQAQEDPSLLILGLGILGSIEKEHGIRAVYQEPWAPLIWQEGYLQKALAVLQNLEKTVSQESLALFQELLTSDEELLTSFTAIKSDLKEKGLIDPDQDLESMVDEQVKKLESAEEIESAKFQGTADKWMSENAEICDLEKEVLQEWKTERERYFQEKKIRNTAKKMAVEKLGYWELYKEEKQTGEVELHIREDYVQGSISDIHIERRRNTGEAYYYDQRLQ